MANMNLVTGYRGSTHVTADDHGSLYAGIFGEGSFVLARGNRLAATPVSGNKINIADGDLVMQGRHGRIAPGSTVSVTIENGAQGYKRHDLIVARYTRNASTSVEEMNLTVVKGTATTGTPADPAYTDGDILNDKAATADFPLYRVVLNGVNIEDVEQLFDVAVFAVLGADGRLSTGAIPSLGYIPTSQKGAANGVAPLDVNGDVPIANLPYSNNPASSSTAMVPTCSALYQVYNKANQALNAAQAATVWVTIDPGFENIEDGGYSKISEALDSGNYDVRLITSEGDEVYYYCKKRSNNKVVFFAYGTALVVDVDDTFTTEDY